MLKHKCFLFTTIYCKIFNIICLDHAAKWCTLAAYFLIDGVEVVRASSSSSSSIRQNWLLIFDRWNSWKASSTNSRLSISRLLGPETWLEYELTRRRWMLMTPPVLTSLSLLFVLFTSYYTTAAVRLQIMTTATFTALRRQKFRGWKKLGLLIWRL